MIDNFIALSILFIQHSLCASHSVDIMFSKSREGTTQFQESAVEKNRK